MLTRDAIIVSLWEAPEISEAIGKMEPAHLRDDLRAEMFLAVCNLPEEKLLTMFESGNLKWYMLRTMLNMIQSDRSTFHNTFRRPTGIYNDPKDVRADFDDWGAIQQTRYESQSIDALEDEPRDDSLAGRVNLAVDLLGFYEQGIFRLFNELGCSHKKVHEATQIPLRTVKWQIAKIRAKLKQTLRTDADTIPVVHDSLHRLHH